jgi:hypothetical protein
MVGDAHVPAAAGPDGVAADVGAADPLDEGGGAEDEPPDEAAVEGAVGSSRLDLFENWHPVSSIDAAKVAVKAQILLVIVSLHFC